MNSNLPAPESTSPERSTFSLAGNLEKLLLIFILLFFCSFAVWRVLLYRDVANHLARIRSAGQPTSGPELDTWYRQVPDAKNGALVLTEAFGLLQIDNPVAGTEAARTELLARTNIWTPATGSLIEAYVQTNQTALAKVQEGLRCSAFRYPIDFSPGYETPVPHLSRLKDAAFLAALQSAIDAENGQPEKWAEDVDLQLKLARTLDTEPILISHLVRNAIIRNAVKSTERGLNRVIPGNEACQKLQNTLTEICQTNLLPAALVGERAIFIPTFRLSWKEIQRLGRDGEDDPPPQSYAGKEPIFPWLTGFFERDLKFYLETMDKATSMAALPAPQCLALTNHFDSACQLARKKAYFLSGKVLPALSRIAIREVSTQVQVDLARTALAIERFKNQSGRLPKNLEELTPKFLDSVPLDRFDGAPLRYRTLPRGYMIYSVDSDGHDDGGKEPPTRKKATAQSTYDITFIVEH